MYNNIEHKKQCLPSTKFIAPSDVQEFFGQVKLILAQNQSNATKEYVDLERNSFVQ